MERIKKFLKDALTLWGLFAKSDKDKAIVETGKKVLDTVDTLESIKK